jgi:hypothetical protein
MAVPVSRGTFPATTSERTTKTERGLIEYSRTQVYLQGTQVTGSIGVGNVTKENKVCTLVDISVNTKNGLSEVTQTFVGGDSTIPEVYEAVAQVAEEPIATHIAFTASTGIYGTSIIDACGGSTTQGTLASAGAVFDADGQFLYFNKQALNNFFGVTSFLTPQVSYKRIYSAGVAPTATVTNLVSHIISVVDGEPPTLPAGRNWMFTSLNWKNNGNGSVGQYEITEEYRGSGNSGWNNAIYYTD